VEAREPGVRELSRLSTFDADGPALLQTHTFSQQSQLNKFVSVDPPRITASTLPAVEQAVGTDRYLPLTPGSGNPAAGCCGLRQRDRQTDVPSDGHCTVT